MSAFASAIAAALGTVHAAAGEAVTYHRGDASVALTAVPGLNLLRTEEISDVPVSANSRDWIFQASELVIGGAVIKPRRGDLVKQTVAGELVVYEVLHDGDQVYRYCDRARTRIRVHTKEVAAGE